MTTKRLAELLRELTPTEFTDSVILMWISNCENTILTDVLLASPEDCVELTELNDAKMLVPHPWDKLYLPYMQAQVAHANGEYDHYANYLALYNAYLEEYIRHILETVRPAGGEAVTHGYYLSAYAIAVEHGYKGTVEQWLKSLIGPQGDGGKDAYTIAVENGFAGTVEQWLASMKGDAATVEIVGATALAAVDAPTVTEVEGSTPAARRYKLGIPAGTRGIPGQAARLEIVGADAIAPGAVPTVTEMAGSTAQYRLYRIGIPRGDKGDKGETTLPVARASSGDGIAYAATDADSGCTLPTVSVADNMSQISAVGKGRQIVFIPYVQNASNAPTLRLNGGAVIPIRLRAPKNQGMSDNAPTATLPVPAGALMRGVPYTMTFCGKYWLVDSQIAQFSCAGNEYQAAVMRTIAEVASGMADGDTIGMPIINSMDGIAGDVSSAFIERSAAEYALPPEDGSVRLPTEQRVNEMIRKDITADYDAWVPESGTEKTVENYAKTLPDGKYYIIHGGTASMDIFTVYEHIKYRFIRRYDDDSCYIELFRGDELTICVEDGASSMMLYGSKMLMDWNIPLPTAADVGKVLMASTVNRAAWTAVANAEEVAV